jgi:cellulose synthase/poly-beta-1,6-N-acetylglucosamine synthase-like glycosyltransferase
MASIGSTPLKIRSNHELMGANRRQLQGSSVARDDPPVAPARSPGLLDDLRSPRECVDEARRSRVIRGAWRPADRSGVAGKFLHVGGERFFVKGVTYGTFGPNEEGEPYPPLWRIKDDFARMREAGINTVRLYTAPSDRIADAAEAAGLYLLPDICWGPRTCEWDYPAWWEKAVNGTRKAARRLGQHPAILMLSLGNEIPPLVVRWSGRERTERYLRTLYEAVKEEAPDAMVTYVNHPPTEYLNLPFLDVVAFNVYLNREEDFRAYMARLHSLAGERPLLLAEMGRDSQESGEAEQMRYLDWQLRAVFEKGLCGAVVYAWTDEWTIFDSNISGWSFGLTTADRSPKPALLAVGDIYRASIYELREKAWPRVSVVVASYNGAATLDECLTAIERLHYPDFEIIVVDDGSKDATPEIIRRHNVRAIHVPNGGLSRARNLGIDASTGEIVAFIDSDAHPDPDWLYYLVFSLEEQNAAAVGGPNIPPRGAGFTAECVDCAPGNPTHVLFDDETAEHIPGCNMAFRKAALVDIGMFDPTHRAAGDDVDVCWKLLVRGQRIAFSPTAVVYHHRRGTAHSYLRQQKGYGYAEAHLQRRYPGRYNFFGHQVWRGNIYDSVNHGLRRHGLPLLFRSRVYQGMFCSEPFQSIYQPFLNWWFQVFTTIEWQGLMGGVLLAGIIGLALSRMAAMVPLALGFAMLSLCLGSSVLCASHASRRKDWRGATRLRGVMLVAWLHLAQPLARAWGRFQGWWVLRKSNDRRPASQRLYGNLLQRSQLLDGLQNHLEACGWVGRPANEWSEHDLEILGPGPYRLFLTTVHEDDVAHAVHYIRYRITARIKRVTPVLMAVIAFALGWTLWHPWLWPLAPPLALLLSKFLTAKPTMVDAISQLTAEFGEAIGMSKALDDF